MKRRLTLSLSAIITLIIITTERVQAFQSPLIDNPSSFNSLEEIINTLFGFVRPIVLLTSVAVIMYGGWVYLTAGSDDAKVANSKKIIVAAVLGFIIIVLAPVILQFIGTLFGVRQGLLDPSV